MDRIRELRERRGSPSPVPRKNADSVNDSLSHGIRDPMYQNTVRNDNETQGLGLVGNNGTGNDVLSPGRLGYRGQEMLGATGGVEGNIGEDMFSDSNN